MSLFVIREWGCSAGRPIEKPSFRCSRPQSTSRTGLPAAIVNARSRRRPIAIVACAVITAVLAASCGGGDASDGDTSESVDTSETEDKASGDGDDSIDSDDAREAADDEADETDSDDEDEADIKASTIREVIPATSLESPAFTSAYERAHSALTEYLSLRNEDYLQALSGVDIALEFAAIQKADSLAALGQQFSNYESDTSAAKRAMRDEYQREREAATRAERTYRDEVDAILEDALNEAALDSEEEYILWRITGGEGAREAEVTKNCYYNCDDKVARIVGRTAWRLAFNASYLAFLNAEISHMGDSPIRVALVAARDSAAAIVADNPLPYENADDALVGSIESALAVASNERDNFLTNISNRIDEAVEYSVNRGERATEAVAAASLKENLSRDLANIDQMEFSALAALDESLAASMDEYVSLVAASDGNHRQAIVGIADTINDARSRFDFDRWSSAAFLLANTYLALATTAQHVELSLRDNPDPGDPKSVIAFEYASTLSSNLASVADSASSLIDNYTPRTILQVEAEFASSSESLFLQAEKFENLLHAARASAEAIAETLDG